MAYFSYVAYDIHGAKITSEVESVNIELAKAELVEAGLTLVEIKPIVTSSTKGSLDKKLSITEIEFFTSQLSLLLNNGLRLDRALQLLRKTSTSDNLKVICAHLVSRVREGDSLSLSLQDVKSFDKIFTSLIAVGEMAGNLPQVLESLSESLKFRKQLAQKIKQAIAYPMMIMIVCFLAIIFIFNFVVPRMSALFEGADNLPWYTEMLLDLTAFFNQYQLFLFAGIIFTFSSLRIAWQTNPAFATKAEALIVNLPLLKNAVGLVERIRYSEAMSMTLGNAVPLEQAMGLSKDVLKVKSFTIEAESAREGVKTGNSMAESMAKCSFFSDTFIGLIEVGEASGNLARIFDEIAARSREQFDGWVARFTALLEPVLILFMAGIVGSVVIIMLMSIINVQNISI